MSPMKFSRGQRSMDMNAMCNSLGWSSGLRSTALAAVLILLGAATACVADDAGSDGSTDEPAVVVSVADNAQVVPTEILITVAIDDAASPGPMVRRADDTLAVGERATGRIVSLPPVEGLPPATVEPGEVLATVDANAEAGGQRGLLGLVEVDEELYAAWTRAGDSRLVVGQVTGGERIIWEGPESTDLANGGHLELGADGRILVGIGDLQNPDLIDEPNAPNGKILSLDPAGSADQEPTVLSSGWNNPYAFTVTGSGDVWVADNAPGEQPERLGQGDVPEVPRADLPDRTAPSVVIDLGPGQIGVCGYLDGDLRVIDVGADGPTIGDTLVEEVCKTGAEVIGEDLLAVADEQAVRYVTLPDSIVDSGA